MWPRRLFEYPAAGAFPLPNFAAPLLRVVVGQEGGTSHVQLARAPVNSLNLETLTELSDWLQYLGSHKDTKAIVLSSAFPGIFSAGLDLAEFNRPTPERLEKFWRALLKVWVLMNTCPKPIIAAVNGNSPAGGCVLALGCDYRVMATHREGDSAKAFSIGLNEAQLGLVAPPWIAAAYAHVLGGRTAERLLAAGEMPTATVAAQIGLVDELTEDPASCVEAAFRHAKRLSAVPPAARTLSRDIARFPHVEYIASEQGQREDTEKFMALVLEESFQTTLSNYLEMLKNRSKK